ncbi:MAG: glycosyl hydrolase family 28-related protein [Verrucomicrobiota bacterium]
MSPFQLAGATFLALTTTSLAQTSPAPTALPNVALFALPNPEPAFPPGFDTFTPPVTAAAPAGGTPAIAEWTRIAAPDRVVALTGSALSANTGASAGKDTQFVVYGQGAGGSLLSTASILRLDGLKAAIVLPSTLPANSEYLLWPVNAAGAGRPVAINATEAWWMGPNAATRGNTVSIFGRNLDQAQAGTTPTSYVYVQQPGSPGLWAGVTAANPYKVDFTVPTGLADGSYQVWIHNGHGGHYGWSGPLPLTVNDGMTWSSQQYNVKDFGAKGDGVTDDQAAIEAAVQAAAASPWSTIYLPAGTYMVSRGFTPAEQRTVARRRRRPDLPGGQRRFRRTRGQRPARLLPALQPGQHQQRHGREHDHRRQRQPQRLRRRSGLPALWQRPAVHQRQHQGQGLRDRRLPRQHTAELPELQPDRRRQRHFLRLGHAGLPQQLPSLRHQRRQHHAHLLGRGRRLLHQHHRAGLRQHPARRLGTGPLLLRLVAMGQQPRLLPGQLHHRRPRRAARLLRPEHGRAGALGKRHQVRGHAHRGDRHRGQLQPRLLLHRSRAHDRHLRCGDRRRHRRRPAPQDHRLQRLDDHRVAAVDRDAGRHQHGHHRGRHLPLRRLQQHAAGQEHLRHADHCVSRIQPYGNSYDFIADGNTISQVRNGIYFWGMNQGDLTPESITPVCFNYVANNVVRNSLNGIVGISEAWNGWPAGQPYPGFTLLANTFVGNTVDTMIGNGLYGNATNGPPGDQFDLTVLDHNTVTNTADAVVFGPDNRILNLIAYKNSLSLGSASSIGSVGLSLGTQEAPALRDNTYTGFATVYGGMQELASAIEAPSHVLAVLGTAGGPAIAPLFSIWNAGTGPLSWTASTDSPWLTVGPASGSTTAEGSANVQVSCSPAKLAPGIYSGTVIFSGGGQSLRYSVNFTVQSPL